MRLDKRAFVCFNRSKGEIFMFFFSTLAAKAPGITTPKDLEQFLQQPGQLKWYIVPIFVITLYLMFTEFKNKHYSVVLGGVAFWLMDVFYGTACLGYDRSGRERVANTRRIQYRDILYVPGFGYVRLQAALRHRGA